jgi:hypothetical protein
MEVHEHTAVSKWVASLWNGPPPTAEEDAHQAEPEVAQQVAIIEPDGEADGKADPRQAAVVAQYQAVRTYKEAMLVEKQRSAAEAKTLRKQKAAYMKARRLEKKEGMSAAEVEKLRKQKAAYMRTWRYKPPLPLKTEQMRSEEKRTKDRTRKKKLRQKQLDAKVTSQSSRCL